MLLSTGNRKDPTINEIKGRLAVDFKVKLSEVESSELLAFSLMSFFFKFHDMIPRFLGDFMSSIIRTFWSVTFRVLGHANSSMGFHYSQETFLEGRFFQSWTMHLHINLGGHETYRSWCWQILILTYVASIPIFLRGFVLFIAELHFRNLCFIWSRYYLLFRRFASAAIFKC